MTLCKLYGEQVSHQCGCKLTATTKKGKYTYYYCTNTKGVCTQHKKYIKESEIESEMLELIKKFIPDKKLLELSLNRYLYEKRKQILQESQQAESLENNIKSVEKRVINLENMYLDDRITGERYDVKKSELQKELTDLQLAKKATKRTNKKNTLELVENFKNKVISLWETFYDGNPDVKKEILESVLWNCGILDKKNPYYQIQTAIYIHEEISSNEGFRKIVEFLRQNLNGLCL